MSVLATTVIGAGPGTDPAVVQQATEGIADHGGDEIALVLLELAVILLAAKVGAHAAERLGQPGVLGELLVGVGVGALTLAGDSKIAAMIDAMREPGSYIDMLAQIGVVLLLFEVGLESSVREMTRVGTAAFAVAAVGIVAPFALGFGLCTMYFDEHPPGIDPLHVNLFVGATLAATSVGLSARIFQDVDRIRSHEARVVLGAAVIDDIMGLVILAVVSGIIVAARDGVSTSATMIVAETSFKAVLFVGLAIFIGVRLAPFGFRYMASMRGSNLLIASTISFCFVAAFLSHQVGLAMIVGAFAAGLALGEAHIRPFLSHDATESPDAHLRRQVNPVSALLVPVFFVVMGMRVHLDAFLRTDVLAFAMLLTLVAIIGKQLCGLAVKGPIASRLAIGFGMIPRGEVGLIVASIGVGLGVVTEDVLSAIVIMVILSTLITPPLLKWALAALPPPASERVLQAGVIPYRLEGNELEVLVISNRDRTHWGVPKGDVEMLGSPVETAAIQALEEAGVTGPVRGARLVTFDYEKSRGRFTCDLYPMLVKKEYDIWPESEWRDRCWLPSREAAARVLHKEIGDAILMLEARWRTGGSITGAGPVN